MSKVKLCEYRSGLGRSKALPLEVLWIVVQWLFISSWFPGSMHRRVILRCFGARVGSGVILKQRIRVKYPWNLFVGDNSWIGEGVWIDNLTSVTIGNDCCISQGAYLCTGSHSWKDATFSLILKPIVICPEAWIAARSVVSPGVTVGEGAVLTLGSCAHGDMSPWGVYQGVPAVRVRTRKIVN